MGEPDDAAVRAAGGDYGLRRLEGVGDFRRGNACVVEMSENKLQHGGGIGVEGAELEAGFGEALVGDEMRLVEVGSPGLNVIGSVGRLNWAERAARSMGGPEAGPSTHSSPRK